ncbi:ParA family protein [uncultured Oscillibacter sp.]|uniref:ParA family protein n=1 Tax=uncultured Oscillibacter sp. TaxID=876091 RepID=UPI0025CFFAE3|nr:ParA family protein [uncultured Oscillibacter sp.]
MGTIITVTNQKGGVGKTTTAAALLCSLYERGQRVLGVDLDPQGSLSFSLGLDTENCATVYDLFKGKVSVEETIASSRGIDILPANILLSAAELEFNRAGREFMLRNELNRVADRYDYIIIDTPPALNVLTVNAYVASHALVIPMVPEILSLLGVAQIKETIDTVQACYNPNLRVLGILLNKYNSRLTLNRDVSEMADQIARQLNTHVFRAVIRSGVSVAEAPAHGESVLSYAPNSKPATDFQSLTTEITSLLCSQQNP